jgi:hypothetical protein
MAVMARESWTDERLDYLSERMDERFDRVDKEFTIVREDIRELRVAVNGMSRAMNQGVVAICATMAGGFATILAALIGVVAF